MKIIKEFLEWNDELYEVLRVIRESHEPNIDVWKEHLGADKALRQGEFLFFVRTVEEAQIIEAPLIDDNPKT